MINRKMMMALVLGVTALSHSAFAQGQNLPTLQAGIKGLQSGWDRIEYQMPNKDAQAHALEALEKKADALVNEYPQNADVKIWDGIIYSTDAGVSGGFTALSKVKKAKALLEDALKIDATAMNGGAHTSLGSLYYKVPGWPIGFGDDDKADKQLRAALAISPNDIDANYFYGDFLIDQEDYEAAIPILEKAMNAPLRDGRAVADAGRRKEIEADLKLARAKAAEEKSEDYN